MGTGRVVGKWVNWEEGQAGGISVHELGDLWGNGALGRMASCRGMWGNCEEV